MRRNSFGRARTWANKMADSRRSHRAAQRDLICPNCQNSLERAPEMSAETLLKLLGDSKKIPQYCPTCQKRETK